MSRTQVISAIIIISLALGLGTAWLAAQAAAPVDSMQLGAWTTWPNAGTSESDPYSRARLARHGELPLGAGEGLVLYATRDENGRALRGNCVYFVEGQTPPARLWTLGLESAAGNPLPGSANVTAIGSDAIVRRNDGSFLVVVSPRPYPGNWLTSDGTGPIRIVVRLYDTTARTLTELSDITMPAIRPGTCG
jgi:hypothetical protein